ncbi:hypothetical protein GALL_62470 [mine drainage metagenome]|uniref:DUF3943 domain-containing protein n=1 Tax=mine drainage metagenome TaxID=410659 RepID=A0A1J5SX67_9ZZZZ
MKTIKISAIVVLCASTTGIAFADDSIVLTIPNTNVKSVEVPSELPPNRTKEDLIFDRETNKSYLIPAVEIIGFDFLLNQFNRRYSGSSDYDSNLSTIWHNLHSSWKDDKDPFKINQLGHPYQGSMYHSFARSAGLNYWESLGYTVAGSAFWEIAGEKVPPSKNDMISTGFGGSFLGEALFRMSNLVLEKGGSSPSFWRETGAAMISPATGFNRYALSDRFDSVFASNDATYYSRLQVGISNSISGNPGTSDEIKRNDAQLDFLLGYGLPGRPGYSYTRPFDYFVFQSTASSVNVLENVMTSGLLVGTDYQIGDNYRGLWGLYGSYDYISPQTFRISSTALSLGTTGQLWLSESIALQGTVMGGIGYAAVGTNNGKTEQDYHYGVAPQGLAALRIIFGKQASIDITGREYFVSDVDNTKTNGHDNIIRADIAFTYRVYKKNAISLKYLWNQRDATFPGLGDKKQSTGTLGIYYTFLGHDGFGETDWR